VSDLDRIYLFVALSTCRSYGAIYLWLPIGYKHTAPTELLIWGWLNTEKKLPPTTPPFQGEGWFYVSLAQNPPSERLCGY